MWWAVTKKFDYSLIRPADILVLNLQLSRFLEPVLDGTNFLNVDLANPFLSLQPRFLWYLIFQRPSRSRLARWIIAVTKTSRAKAVLAMDNFNVGHHHRQKRLLLDELSAAMRKTSVIAIQHGQELRRLPIQGQKSEVVNLCWGNWVARHFPTFGRTEGRFHVVGPLVDSLYREIRPQTITKDVEIVLISTVKDESWWGPEIGDRRMGYEILVEHLKRYLETRKVRCCIALTIDRDQNPSINEAELEKKWFSDRFGTSVEFSDPTKFLGDERYTDGNQRQPRYVKERYSTYFLCDRAKLTLGMSSTVLWESFGRGNKVLSVNSSKNSAYDFPIPGPWSLIDADYDEFEKRVDYLLNLPTEEWDTLSIAARNDLVYLDATESSYLKIRKFIFDEIAAS